MIGRRIRQADSKCFSVFARSVTLSYMDIKLMTGAEPFFFSGGRIGCLVLHGLTAAPQEMYWFGKHLAECGATVHGPRLHGHGVNRHYLRHTRWQDWYLSALDGYHLLRSQCDQVYVIGLSMGAMISFLLAASEQVAGVVALAAPLSLAIPGISLIHGLRYVYPFLPVYDRTKDPLDERVRQIQQERGEPVTGRVTYWQFSTVSVSEFVKLQREVSSNLGNIEVPVLLVYSEKDRLVPMSNANLLASKLTRSRKVEQLRLKSSEHVITADVENQTVFDAAWSFIERNSH
jgi:carboxylesterase